MLRDSHHRDTTDALALLSGVPWRAERVRAGMGGLLEGREAALAGGARPRGWKVAFGTTAGAAATGLSGPVVGHLTSATELRCGDACRVEGWTAPKLEPEIAIHIGAPLGAGADGAAARQSIAGVSAAIELADADLPPERVQEVLAGNIFHRAFVLAGPEPAGALPAEAVAVDLERDGAPLASTIDAEATVGPLPELTAYVARYLAAFGQELSPGEVVISGSTVPLVDVEPGQEFRAAVAGAGDVSVVVPAAGGRDG